VKWTDSIRSSISELADDKDEEVRKEAKNFLNLLEKK